MTASADDAYDLLRQIRYDATAIQGKVSALFSVLNELDLPEAMPEWTCPRCAGLAFKAAHLLADHQVNVHHGEEAA